MTDGIITACLGTHDGHTATAFTTMRAVGRSPELLCPALGVSTKRFARPHQVHSTVVRQIAEEFFSLTEETRTMLLDGVDAVIYDVRDACIGISTADCIPVLCYDTEHHCAAAIHAGWRGTVARIVTKAVEMMQETYHTDPSKLTCIIGPGIEAASFEVGDEVYEAFKEVGFPMEEMAKRMPAKGARHSGKEWKWHLDIKLCNKMQLISLGVKEQNITVSDIDTMTDSRFFSARRDGNTTGRMLSGIILR